jgi:hypothetical protein
MPSTPLAGQISFTQIKELTTDKLGYTPPANVSIGTLAGVIRQFGQKAPGANNIAFSNFYFSTIGGFTITTTPIKFTKKCWVNRCDTTISAQGTITVWFKSNTFKRNSNNNFSVRVEIKQQILPDWQKILQNEPRSAEYTVVATITKNIDWNNPNNDNFIKYTDAQFNNSGLRITNTGLLYILDREKGINYIITVSDLTTGAIIGISNVVVNIQGSSNSYYVNA